MHSLNSPLVAGLLFAWAVTHVAPTSLAQTPTDTAFKSEVDGTDQRYVFVLPDGFDPKQSYSVLIALHGHGSDRWQFVKDERAECKAARDIAAKHKLIYVSPDYRAKTSWMGPKAEADLIQILEQLKTKFRLNKIIISGGSMGGTGALTFAAMHPNLVDGVVAMNATANLVEYDQFQEAIAESFGGTKQEKPEEYRNRSAELHHERLTMPIAMTTGGKDRTVPPDSVLRLTKALEKEKRKVKLIHQPDGEHSTNYVDATAAYEFVLEELSKAQSNSAK